MQPRIGCPAKVRTVGFAQSLDSWRGLGQPMNQLEERKDQIGVHEATEQENQITSSDAQDTSKMDLKSHEARLARRKVCKTPYFEEAARQHEAGDSFQTSIDLIFPFEARLQALWSNLKCLLTPRPSEHSGVTATLIPTDLILEEPPWFRTIFSHVRDVVTRSGLPGTARNDSNELFRDYKIQPRSLLFSSLLHLLVLAGLLFLPYLYVEPAKKTKVTETQVSLIVPYKLILHLPNNPDASGGGGGGGRRESTPASLGRLPRSADRQLTPPVPRVINLNPLLTVEPTVIAPPLSQLPAANLPYYGDPFGVPGPPSSGPGTGGGIGSGTGGGVGPGTGSGVGPGRGGGFGGGDLGSGVYRVGGGVTPPSVIYRVEPAYSEEARKARYQGTVVLSAIVRKDGTLEVLKVVRGVGLSLDENAIQALRQWKFRPGAKDGTPVDVFLYVEVNFSLR